MDATPAPPPSTPNPGGSADAAPDATGPSPLERLASFRFTYVAIFVFAVAYVFTVEGLEDLLAYHYRTVLEEAVAVAPAPEAPTQVQDNVREVVTQSRWTKLGVRVRPIVLGADGITLLYAGGRMPLPRLDQIGIEALLPAQVDVEVSVPHNAVLTNAVLVGYGAMLMAALAIYTRRLTRRAQQRLSGALDARDRSRQRAGEIESELQQVSARLASVEPEKELYADEIDSLEEERKGLLTRLAELEAREAGLREQAPSVPDDLEQERRALEELLEEAVHDVEQRDEEIRLLQKEAKRGGRDRTKDAEALERRFRTLYKNVEMDDRALQEIGKLGDEGLRLKAEEAIKRLCDEPDSAAVRRKLGGLPPYLTIFELGFAGKGRIYYTRGQSRRYRVLLVGAKNRQKPDLEYLSRLPKGT